MGRTILYLLVATLALSCCDGHKDDKKGHKDDKKGPPEWVSPPGHEHGRGHVHGQGHGCGQGHGHGREQGHGHGRGQGHGHEQGHRHGHGQGHVHGQGHGHGRGHKHHHNCSLSDDTIKLLRPNSQFAFRLYKQIASQPEYQNKNVFFSPLSVSLTLAALSLGARGGTFEELFDGLGFNSTPITKKEVNEGFRAILQNLNQQKEIDLRAGSALFMKNAFKPNSEFLESMKTYYLSDGFTTNFTQTEEAAKMINDYVKTKTNGTISNIVDQLDPATVMYLVSYIYFKGNWEVPFDPEMTQDGLFKVNEKTSVSVKMMTKKSDYNVYQDQDMSATVLQLFYTKSVSMMLLLPDNDLAVLEERISPELVAKWHRWIKIREALVYIPKLSIETSYSLRNILAGMGMPNIFSYSANFTGIVDEPIFVSEVTHKATLDVDEKGSTASAATGVAMIPLSFRPFLTIKFDRPFLVVIYNHDTGSILFLGKVVNPAN